MSNPKAVKSAIGVRSATRTVALHREQAPLYGVDRQHLRTVTAVTVDEWWIESALPGHADWVVASRVIGDDRGVPVVAELRVFPKCGVVDRHRAPGTWEAEYLGARVGQGRIPRGGISATMVRKAAASSVRHHARSAVALRASAMMFGPKETETVHGRYIRESLDAAGITAMDLAAEARRLQRRQPGTSQGRGRPPKWSAAHYAKIALTYDDAVRENRAPIQAVRKVHRLTHAQARNLVARARTHGFIHQAPNQGRAAEPLPDEQRQQLHRIAARRKGRGPGRRL